MSTIWTKNFVAILFINLMIFTCFQLVSPAFPVFINSLGGSNTIVGLVSSAYVISGLIMRPFSGLLLDKMGRKSIILIGLAIIVLANFSYIWFTSIVLIFFLRFIHGFGWGISTTSASTVAADNIPKERLGEGMGYFSLTNGLAMAIAPAAGLYIISASSFDRLFSIAAGMGALALVLALLIRFQELPEKEPSTVSSQGKSALFEKSAIAPSLTYGFLATTYAAIVNYVPLYSLELGIANIGIFFTVYAGALLLIRPLIGRAVDRIGHDKIMVLSIILIGVALLLLSQAQHLYIFLVAAFLYGAGYGSSQMCLFVLALANAPAGSVGRANATFYTALDIGLGTGAITMGYISSLTGYGPLYLWALLPVAAAAALYFICVRKKAGLED